jgi:hypothetical protein
LSATLTSAYPVLLNILKVDGDDLRWEPLEVRKRCYRGVLNVDFALKEKTLAVGGLFFLKRNDPR